MGIKGKTLNKPKPIEEEDVIDMNAGLDVDIEDVDLNFDDDDEEPPVKTKKAEPKSPPKDKKKSPAKVDQDDDLNLDDLDIDEIDGDDLEARSHADLSTKDLQGGKLGIDILTPLLDRLNSFEEHVDVAINNVGNRVNSMSGLVDTAVTRAVEIKKTQVELKDVLQAVLGRVTALEECYRALNTMMGSSIPDVANVDQLVSRMESKPPKAKKEDEPVANGKTAKRTARPDRYTPEHGQMIVAMVNRATAPVAWDKVMATLASKWKGHPAADLISLLKHIGYTQDQPLVPGAIAAYK